VPPSDCCAFWRRCRVRAQDVPGTSPKKVHRYLQSAVGTGDVEDSLRRTGATNERCPGMPRWCADSPPVAPANDRRRKAEAETESCQEIEEPFEGRGWLLELCPEGSPKRYVLPERTAQGCHRAPPRAGHGWATSRNASKATWV